MTTTRRLRSVHARRRARFLREIAGGAAIFRTNTIKLRNIHHEYLFRPESDLVYLTGCDEPEAIAVLAPRQKKKFHLFLRPADPKEEVWTGRRPALAEARRRWRADAVHTLDEFDEMLPKLLDHTGRLYYRVGVDPEFDARILEMVRRLRPLARRGVAAPTELHDPHTVLQWMRLRKSREEIALMERAAEITAEGHLAALDALRPGMFEYEIEALIGYHFRRHGARAHAYLPIVAAGNNATVLHYNDNDQRIRDGDLVLIDCGAEYDFYACDITRTLPANGVYSPEQRALYEVVLRANRAVVRAARPGSTIPKLQERATRVIAEGLVALGVLRGRATAAIRKRAHERYYMHGVGHWLGLDTHDACAYRTPAGKPVRLEPGMVMTVEPGIYIARDDRKAPKRYRGIGIRIEDNILITPRGNRVLTDAVPREPDEIEARMARRS